LKKIIPILLLLVFFLFQGGRVILYFECRITNAITSPSCDCVKILADAKPGPETIPNSNHANHKHLTEEFEPAATNLPGNIASLNRAECIDLTSLIPAGALQDIFHPPAA
jgi:hypothetical protein